MPDSSHLPLRTAIIGTGSIAHNHMIGVQNETNRIHLVAAADINDVVLDEFCNRYNIPNRYTNVDCLLEHEKLDFAIICTPPATHLELCVKAMEAGLNVLCEKPLVASLAEVDKLQAIERETGKSCAAGFHWRYGSGGQHIKHLIEQSAFGKPLLGICQTTWYRDSSYYAVPWRGKWETELGGVATSMGIHAMDFFLWLLGDWAEVTAVAKTLDHDIEVETVALATVQFQSGALGSIINSSVSPREVSTIRLDFQQATIELEHLYHYNNEDWRISPISTVSESVQDGWNQFPTNVYAHQDAQLTGVLDNIVAGNPPVTHGKESRRTIEFLTALYKSAITDQPVQQGSILPDDSFYYQMYGDVFPNLRI